MTIVLCAGCATTPPVVKGQKDPQETVSALSTMTQGMTNQDLSREDLKRLAEQVRSNPEAQSAVKAVNSSFEVQDTGVKYCPVDGKRYSSRLEDCPEHNTKLIPVD